MNASNGMLGKWAASCEIVRALVAARDALDEAGINTKELDTRIEDARWTFVRTLPLRVQEELRHG
jgi:hypothetical protein